MLRENIPDVDVPVIRRRRHDLRDLRLMRIPDHPLHARQCRQLLRRSLRVAARHQNPRLWIFAMHPPDRLPHIVIRRRRHRAGIEHHQVRPSALTAAVKPLPRKQRFQSRAIRLRSPAPKILNEKFPHRFHCRTGILACPPVTR